MFGVLLKHYHIQKPGPFLSVLENTEALKGALWC